MSDLDLYSLERRAYHTAFMVGLCLVRRGVLIRYWAGDVRRWLKGLR